MKKRIVYDNDGRIIEGLEYLQHIAAAPDHQTEVEIVNPPAEVAAKLVDSMAEQRKEKFGKYSLAFRITRSNSGKGFDVKPFDLPPAIEPTTFALCMEVRGRREADGWEKVRVEINSRTVGFRSETEGYEFDEAACNYLKSLWSQWWAGNTLDRGIAQQFAAVRNDSQRTLKEVYGKPQGFTKGEFEQLAAEWHEALTRAKYWDGILPRPASELRGLRGWYGAGGETNA